MNEPTSLVAVFDVGLLVALLALCVVIAVIDWRQRIIPNRCNLAVAALGLLHAGVDGIDATIWAAASGLTLLALFWLLRRLYQAIRSVQGLGLGDVKFLGAAGTWIGLEGIAPLILVACLSALAYIGLDVMRGRAVTGQHAVPFGPFLVLGLVTVLGFTMA